jgi:hypothetical protein
VPKEQNITVLVAPHGAPFRILQVTDFHNDQDDDLARQTYENVAAMVQHFRPAMVAVTGDNWCSDAEPEEAPRRLARDIGFLGSLGLPWGLVWGNHDYAADFQAALGAIAAAPGSLLPEAAVDGSFRTSIHVDQDPLPRWDLFFINTREQWHLPHDLSWFKEESLRLAAVREAIVPALVFCHFPMRHYQAAIDAGCVTGEAHEEVLYWGDEEGLAAPMIKAPGNVRGVFCGHSHKNDCWFEEDGVIFGYGRATGLGGYGGEVLRKGAKLIELDLELGRFTATTVFADGTGP